MKQMSFYIRPEVKSFMVFCPLIWKFIYLITKILPSISYMRRQDLCSLLS